MSINFYERELKKENLAGVRNYAQIHFVHLNQDSYFDAGGDFDRAGFENWCFREFGYLKYKVYFYD